MRCKKLIKIAAALAIAAPVYSHAYPNRPITVIVPFAAGSSTDVVARTFGDALSKHVTNSVAIDNRTGAEGQIGAREVLNGSIDGHTLLFTSSSVPILDPLMKASLPYNPATDFTPVCAVSSINFLLNINDASPFKSVNELIEAAKAAPGKLTFGYSSASMRLAGELFQQVADIKLTGVPYRSSVAALTEVSAGLVDMVFIDAISAKPFYQPGKLRPLVVSAQTRLKEFPSVPSASEAGLPNFQVAPWWGVYVTGKTPPSVVSQVREKVATAVNSPELKAALEARNIQPLAICGDAMETFQENELGNWRDVVNRAGITPQ